jgi:uncharacterized protein involved in exopolysaccharide biosynthesis
LEFLYNKKIFNKKNLLASLAITFIFSALGIFYSLSLENYFTSKAVISSQKTNSSSDGLNLKGFGIPGMSNLFKGGGNKNFEELAFTMTSRDYVINFIIKNNLKKRIYAAEKIINNTLIYNEKLIGKDQKWLNGKEPSNDQVYSKFKKDILSVEVDRDKEFITISITDLDPFFSKELLIRFIDDLDFYTLKRKEKELNNSIAFLESKLDDATALNLKLIINQLIENNIQELSLISAKDNYSFVVLDSPFVPSNKSKPARMFIVLVFIMAGILISYTVIIFRNIFS